MSRREHRRYDRTRCADRLRLGWTTDDGVEVFTQGTCVDVSRNGVRLESREPIPLRTSVSMRAERVNLCGAASVRHITRRGWKYVIGLELSQTLDLHALDFTPTQ
jgi:hypothetical protein